LAGRSPGRRHFRLLGQECLNRRRTPLREELIGSDDNGKSRATDDDCGCDSLG
jgi:hypothetical protein